MVAQTSSTATARRSIGGQRRRTRSARATVLVAEGDDASRRFFGYVLTSAGYSVLTAESGPGALRLFRDYRINIDVLLAGFDMQDGNGLELAGVVEQLYPGTSILLITGYGVPDPGINSEWQTIQKPLGPRELLAAVATALRISGYRPDGGAGPRGIRESEPARSAESAPRLDAPGRPDASTLCS